MVAHPQQQKISVEDYFLLDQTSEIRYEYLDGYAYAMSGGTIAHARIAFTLAKLLDTKLIEGPCRVHTSDVRVQLSEARYVYPDVTVSCDVADHQEQETTIHAPHLVVEVLSPSTEAYDRGQKFLAYQKCATIQEYVLVNTRQQLIEVFRRQATIWTYQRFESGQVVHLESLDIQLPVTAIYERVSVPIEEDDGS
jgi:Uma2 family endonuclease